MFLSFQFDLFLFFYFVLLSFFFFFFFNDPATTEIYTLSYTTLFRSLLRPGGLLYCPITFDGGTVKRDRKSTRLNSSHRTISYAVFCLKKKKKKKSKKNKKTKNKTTKKCNKNYAQTLCLD